jgi:uncharacterized membrane protein YeiH
VLAEFSAVAVFAVTGALVASRKEMDIFGFALLATVTGIGGGTVRDLMLGRLPVFWVVEPSFVAVCLVVSTVVYFTAHIPQSRYRVLLWLDAAGLGLVAVLGAERGLAAGAGDFIATVMGVITAVFGGIIRDVLGGESPVILRKEIYVIPALIGAAAFVALEHAGWERWATLTTGALACFVVRGLAIQYRWALPTYRSRPGRDFPPEGTSGRGGRP